MKGYRFITDDDTSKFCHRVTEALSNGWKLHGEPKMIFDQKRGVFLCVKAFPQVVHLKAFSWLCVLMWDSRGDCKANARPQILQEYGFTPVCVRLWA